MGPTKLPDKSLNELESGIINTLLYSGIFDYPLTEEELIRFYQVKVNDINIFRATIDALLQKKLIYRMNGYILLMDDEDLVTRRLNANRLANRFLPIAFKFSNVLFRFPFVRGICLSGSISKNSFYEGNDIDFFVIAEKKRIWLLQLIIMFYRKSMSRKRRHFFCINYLIEKGSSVYPMNLFTATELVTLIPTSGMNTCYEFINKNNWANQYFPNLKLNGESIHQDEPVSRLKRFIEYICDNRLFDFINDAIMGVMITRIKWQVKTNRVKVADKASFFNTVNRKMIRINNVNDNQSRILRLFDMACREFENTNNIRLFKGDE